MIRLDKINVILPDFSLKDICLEIRDNDFFALIGPTGSGKSLLLETIMGIMPVNSGRIFNNDVDITDLAVEKRGLAIVYQDFALFPHLSVKKNILYGTRYYRLSEKTVKNRFEMLVSSMGLEKLLNRLPAGLSGGEKQRTALARSLMLNPSALLLDEPLSALDPVFLEDIKGLMKQIHRRFDVTMVMVSHSLPDVLYLANRGAIINDGLILQTGDIEDIFEKPDSEFTANFVGMKNLFPVSQKKGGLYIGDKNIISEERGEAFTHAGIRPENLELITPGESTYANTFSGEVTEISSSGIYCTVTLKTASRIFTAIWPRSIIRNYGIEAGKQLSFGFHPEHVHLFKQIPR